MLALKVTAAGPRLSGFKFFWMKRVTGFRSEVHCARCLTGGYVREVGLSMPTNLDVLIPAAPGDVFYLCGVSTPYRHGNNLHLAMVCSPGDQAEVTAYTGEVVTIRDAKALPFDDKAARSRFPGRGADFLTCRNFQFGAHHFPE